nr:MAG TPA: hypothetical protein [Caudoviricetes sp.]
MGNSNRLDSLRKINMCRRDNGIYTSRNTSRYRHEKEN